MKKKIDHIAFRALVAFMVNMLVSWGTVWVVKSAIQTFCDISLHAAVKAVIWGAFGGGIAVFLSVSMEKNSWILQKTNGCNTEKEVKRSFRNFWGSLVISILIIMLCIMVSKKIVPEDIFIEATGGTLGSAWLSIFWGLEARRTNCLRGRNFPG